MKANRVIALFVFFVGLVLLMCMRIPVRATVTVPFENRLNMEANLKRLGVQTITPTVAHFRGADFHVENGIALWLVESEVLERAMIEDYYCSLSFQPFFRSFRWYRSVGDSSTVGVTSDIDPSFGVGVEADPMFDRTSDLEVEHPAAK